jgi:cysteine rich repeat protein
MMSPEYFDQRGWNVTRSVKFFCLLLSLTVSSVSFSALTTAAQSADQLAAIRSACADDAKKFCSSVQPGGGRVIACLKEHKDSLSAACRQAAGVPASPSSTSAPSNPSSPSDGGASVPATNSPAASAGAGTKAPSTTGVTAHGSYLRLKQVQIIARVDDAAFGGKAELPALDLLIPSGWNFKGSVGANSKEGCFSDTFAPTWEAISPDGSIAFQGAANDSWQYADDPAVLKNLNDPIRRARGAQNKPCPVKKPVKAEEYFRQEVLPVFPSGSSVVSVEPFPELNQIARKQLGLSSKDGGSSDSARTEAIRARVKYQKDGKSQESWVALVVVTHVFSQGRGNFYDSHATNITALRAPQGQLDSNDKLFKAMISSIRPEQRWQKFANGFIAKAYQAEAQKEAGMDSMISAFRKYEADVINGVTENAMRGSMNSAFAFDQNIRGVQTFRDPSTGRTMELSNLFDHAWLNNAGNEYVMSDDPNFNPKSVFDGDWNQLQVVRPQP